MGRGPGPWAARLSAAYVPILPNLRSPSGKGEWASASLKLARQGSLDPKPRARIVVEPC